MHLAHFGTILLAMLIKVARIHGLRELALCCLAEGRGVEPLSVLPLAGFKPGCHANGEPSSGGNHTPSLQAIHPEGCSVRPAPNLSP